VNGIKTLSLNPLSLTKHSVMKGRKKTEKSFATLRVMMGVWQPQPTSHPSLTLRHPDCLHNNERAKLSHPRPPRRINTQSESDVVQTIQFMMLMSFYLCCDGAKGGTGKKKLSTGRERRKCFLLEWLT
jgi:hypothetical protein